MRTVTILYFEILLSKLANQPVWLHKNLLYRSLPGLSNFRCFTGAYLVGGRIFPFEGALVVMTKKVTRNAVALGEISRSPPTRYAPHRQSYYLRFKLSSRSMIESPISYKHSAPKSFTAPPQSGARIDTRS